MVPGKSVRRERELWTISKVAPARAGLAFGWRRWWGEAPFEADPEWPT